MCCWCVEVRLEPEEIATFSGFVLSLDDGRFGVLPGATSAGFSVSERVPGNPFRPRPIDQVSTELVAVVSVLLKFRQVRNHSRASSISWLVKTTLPPSRSARQ